MESTGNEWYEGGDLSCRLKKLYKIICKGEFGDEPQVYPELAYKIEHLLAKLSAISPSLDMNVVIEKPKFVSYIASERGDGLGKNPCCRLIGEGSTPEEATKNSLALASAPSV